MMRFRCPLSRRSLLCLLTGAGILTVCAIGPRQFFPQDRPTPTNWAKLQPGMDQAEVRALIGSPLKVEYEWQGTGEERTLTRPLRWHYGGGTSVVWDEYLTVQSLEKIP